MIRRLREIRDGVIVQRLPANGTCRCALPVAERIHEHGKRKRRLMIDRLNNIDMVRICAAGGIAASAHFITAVHEIHASFQDTVPRPAAVALLGISIGLDRHASMISCMISMHNGVFPFPERTRAAHRLNDQLVQLHALLQHVRVRESEALPVDKRVQIVDTTANLPFQMFTD